MLEDLIEQWRTYVRGRRAIDPADIAELEDHLREQVATLTSAGLAEDEAFLIAVKRLGGLDQLSAEFAREHSDRLWKQLVVPPADAGAQRSAMLRDALVAIGLAVLAGVLIKLPSFFGLDFDEDGRFYARNMSFFALPLVTAYFLWKRGASPRMMFGVATAFVTAAVVVNLYPFLPQAGAADAAAAPGNTEALAALHLPIALWIVAGVAYAGSRWHEVAGRMDFIRFSGEIFIYYVLIALGGGVLMGFTFGIFEAIGIDIEPFFEQWILPVGVMGAILVAAWLVETKQSVIENMAPVLARLFTPLFTIVLLVYLAIVLGTGRGINVEREVLIVFDMLLVVVLGLVLYSISARDPRAPAGAFDWLQLVLVIAALLANTVALWAMMSRISELGFTPNRTAALGLNLLLLVNLGWSAVLSLRFLRGRGTTADLERWQTQYLPVWAAWAAVVVVVFPPLFGWA